MSNLKFFQGCWANELAATCALIDALPADKMEYRPHPTNRSASEIVEHLLGHALDLTTIIRKEVCDETLRFEFSSPKDAAAQYAKLAAEVTDALSSVSEQEWEQGMVELKIEGKSFITIPRMNMMWFFFFDIIHHRGQLSSYVRPMGGKNPAVYGYSADTIS